MSDEIQSDMPAVCFRVGEAVKDATVGDAIMATIATAAFLGVAHGVPRDDLNAILEAQWKVATEAKRAATEAEGSKK